MNRNKLGIVIIAIGIIIVLYPIVSNIVASYTQTTVISTYKDMIKQMEQDQIEAEKAKAREYNEKLSDTNDVSIQIGEEPVNEESQGVSYLNVLGIGEAFGYISIPKINIYLPIYHGTSEAVLQSGVGHVENSSFPIGERNTHAVLAGHTGLVRTKIFDDIDELENGDKFYIYILNEEYAYQIDQVKIVEPENTEDVQIQEDKEYVTLLTCTPYGINSHRLLVRGSRVETDITEETDEENQVVMNDDTQSIEKSRQELYKQIIFAILIFLGLIILIVLSIIVTDMIKRIIDNRKK